MNSYEAKQEARRERLEAAADKADARAAGAYSRADLREEASGIPLGQPILVGHHSEGRHRRAIERAENAMRRSVEEGKHAEELRAKAAGVGTGGISSDDPEATEKLAAKIKAAEDKQTFMKSANALLRKAMKAGACPINENAEFRAFAKDLAKVLGTEDATAAAKAMLEPDFAGRRGFASYQLTNNNANIRRMKLRLEQLQRDQNREDKEHEFDGVTVKENTEENRVQFIFDGKPDSDVRAILKQHGFRWAPSQNAWQRHLNNNGIYSARLVLAKLKEKS